MNDNDVYVIRLHPRGGYAWLHCDLDGFEAVEVPFEVERFHSHTAALAFAAAENVKNPAVHGVRTHPEIAYLT